MQCDDRQGGIYRKNVFWLDALLMTSFAKKEKKFCLLFWLIKTDYVASQIEKRTSIHQCVIDLPDCFKCRREGEGRREKGTSPTNSCTGPVLRNTRNSS